MATHEPILSLSFDHIDDLPPAYLRGWDEISVSIVENFLEGHELDPENVLEMVADINFKPETGLGSRKLSVMLGPAKFGSTPKDDS